MLQTSFPVERLALSNGLRAVLAPDRSSPAVAVAVYYDVGFRSEPEGRTGFAHLFEHLMFQGSATLEKLEHFRLVQSNGGVFNGSTRNDFTNYFELLPSTALELGLFLEADRMRAIRLTEDNLRNQVDVVKEEILVNVVNQPYGGFPWIDLPMVLFRTFPNAHNAYGEFADLEAATVDEAREFFDRYYAPGNAVLVAAGDLDPDEAGRLVERHFGDIPARPVPPAVDASEPEPPAERRLVKPDALAPEPAVAIGYRTPDPLQEPDAYAAAVLLAAVLADGEASRLQQRLVKRDRLASRIFARVGLVADAFEVRAPSMLQLVAFYPSGRSLAGVLRAVDEECARVADGLDAEELDRVRTQMASGYLGSVDGLLQRTLLMAAFEQQRGGAELVNEVPTWLAGLTAESVSEVAGRYLRPDARALVDLRPGRG